MAQAERDRTMAESAESVTMPPVETDLYVTMTAGSELGGINRPASEWANPFYAEVRRDEWQRFEIGAIIAAEVVGLRPIPTASGQFRVVFSLPDALNPAVTSMNAGEHVFGASDFLRVAMVNGRPHWISHVANGRSVNLVPLTTWEMAWRRWYGRAAQPGRWARRRVLRLWDSMVLLFDRDGR